MKIKVAEQGTPNIKTLTLNLLKGQQLLGSDLSNKGPIMKEVN